MIQYRPYYIHCVRDLNLNSAQAVSCRARTWSVQYDHGGPHRSSQGSAVEGVRKSLQGTAVHHTPSRASLFQGMARYVSRVNSFTLLTRACLAHNGDVGILGCRRSYLPSHPSVPSSPLPTSLPGAPSSLLPTSLPGTPSSPLPTSLPGAPSSHLPTSLPGAPSSHLPTSLPGAPSSHLPRRLGERRTLTWSRRLPPAQTMKRHHSQRHSHHQRRYAIASYHISVSMVEVGTLSDK